MALGDLGIAVFVTVYSDLYFQCLHRLLFFSMFASSSVFFNVYAFLCFLNVISTSAFFDVLHQHMLFNVYVDLVILMLDQQLFASVSQKSKFSRQYLVCLSFGTNIRLCHRSAVSAQTISQSSLNIVSGEFFVIRTWGVDKMKKLVIVKSVRLHPSRENKYLAGREVVKKKRSFYGQDNRKS